MAKEKVEKSVREELWERYLANYAESNPVKFAEKKERKEFDKIPPSFIGKVVKTPKGEVIV